MDVEEYFEKAGRTATNKNSMYLDDSEGVLMMCALGLTGEAGEFADEVKKHFFHGHELDFEKLDKEGGDQLWYLNRYCMLRSRMLGRPFTLADLMNLNIAKLKKRYPDEFNTEDSLARVDEELYSEEEILEVAKNLPSRNSGS